MGHLNVQTHSSLILPKGNSRETIPSGYPHLEPAKTQGHLAYANAEIAHEREH